MKTQRADQMKMVRWLSTLLLFGAVLTMMYPAGVLADGTSSGTEIRNQATIDYNVNGAAQDQILSQGNDAGTGETVFVVDNKVDLSIASPGIQNVTPSTTTTPLLVTVNNEGNTTQGYRIELQDPTASNDFNMTFVDIYLDNGATPGVFDGSDAHYYRFVPGTGGSFILPQERAGNADEDAVLNIWVVATVPSTATDTHQARYHLIATTLDAGTDTVTANDNGVWTAMGTPQVVLADGAGVVDTGLNTPNAGDHPDGRFSITITYTVTAAALAVNKVSTVISDGFNSTNPKAIPGAVIRYAIDVVNSGGSNADSVVIRDQIPGNTDFVAGSASATNSDGTATMTIEYSVTGAAGTWAAAETSPVNYVRVTHSHVLATNGTAGLVFQVTIK